MVFEYAKLLNKLNRHCPLAYKAGKPQHMKSKPDYATLIAKLNRAQKHIFDLEACWKVCMKASQTRQEHRRLRSPRPCRVLDREKAEIGVYIAFAEPTAP